MKPSLVRRPRARRRAVAVVVSLLASTALAACGSSDDDKPLSADSPRKVTITIGATINFAAPHVALEKGFWKKQGLDVDLAKQANGAPASIAGLIQGDSVMALTGAPSVIAPLGQGAPLKMVVTVGLGYSIELTARKGFMEKHSVTRSSSLEDRVKALKGAKLGYDVPGGSMDRFYRYLFKAYGVDPDKDVTMVALKSADVELAALKRGDIDVMAGSPPVGVTAEAEGAGERYLEPTEVPGLNDYPYLVGSMSTREIKDHPDVVKAIVKGLMEALEFIKAHPDETKPIVREGFKDMPEDAFNAAFEDVLRVMPPSPLITEKSFDTLVDFEKAGGSDTSKLVYDDTVAASIVNEALQ